MSSKLTQSRTDTNAKKLFLDGLHHPNKAPGIVVTDGLSSYVNAMNGTLRCKGTKHIRKPRFVDLANNNRIERLHSTMRERTKTMRGFDTDPTANLTMQGFQVYYNYLRPHMALNGGTPAQAANVDLKLGRNKWKSMIEQSVENGSNPPKEKAKKAKYRKHIAIGSIRAYIQGKRSLGWLKGSLAYLRSKRGLTDRELEQVLMYLGAQHLKGIL